MRCVFFPTQSVSLPLSPSLSLSLVHGSLVDENVMENRKKHNSKPVYETATIIIAIIMIIIIIKIPARRRWKKINWNWYPFETASNKYTFVRREDTSESLSFSLSSYHGCRLFGADSKRRNVIGSILLTFCRLKIIIIVWNGSSRGDVWLPSYRPILSLGGVRQWVVDVHVCVCACQALLGCVHGLMPN